MDNYDDNIIAIYFGGSKEQWNAIFSKYEMQRIDEAETAYDKGIAFADKINQMAGMEYDSDKFEFHYSATIKDVLK